MKTFILITAMMVSSAACAASFDCAKAAAKVEKLICSDAGLSSLDEQLNAAYKGAAGRAANKPGVRQSQRDWLASYALAACHDAACLKKAFAERIALLEAVSAAGEPASGWTGYFVRYANGKEDPDKAAISVLGLRTGRLLVSGKALWYGPNAGQGQVNTGDMAGLSAQVGPRNTAMFDADGCTATLALRGDVLDVQDESGCGGMNVTFNGQYRRK